MSEKGKMKLPPGMSEEEVVRIIYKVVNILAGKFRFGYHGIEDMKQEGAVFAIEAINSGAYDNSRPLENFLYTHIRNRFINYKRNKYIRNEPPCKTCLFFDPKLKKSKNQCAAFPDKDECKKLSDWQMRNDAKKNLMKPLDVTLVSEGVVESDMSANEIELEEFKNIINVNLPLELRSDYLRMVAGIQIPKNRKDKVKQAILEIRKKYYGEENDG